MISHEIYLFSLQLNQAYWACADGTADKAAHQLFVPNGRLQLGSLELAGRDQIERFFKERSLANHESWPGHSTLFQWFHSSGREQRALAGELSCDGFRWHRRPTPFF